MKQILTNAYGSPLSSNARDVLSELSIENRFKEEEDAPNSVSSYTESSVSGIRVPNLLNPRARVNIPDNDLVSVVETEPEHEFEVINDTEVTEVNELLLADKKVSCWQSLCSNLSDINCKILIPSTLIGIGTGVALTPIFNHEVQHLDKFGINVHANEYSFTTSTINSLGVNSLCSILSMYHFFKEYGEAEQANIECWKKTLSHLGKGGAVLSTLMPAALLWNIELNNQKIEGSEGFDKFVAYATASTIPLLVFKTIESYEGLNKMIQNPDSFKWTTGLNSLGAKIAVYGIKTLSMVGNTVSFSSIASELFKKTELFDKDTSEGLGYMVGTITSCMINSVTEHQAVKSLFTNSKEPITFKKAITAIGSAIEGSWMALPIVGVGLEAAKSWNPLIKGAVFGSSFASIATYEATNIYKSFYPDNHKQDEAGIDLVGHIGEDYDELA